MRERRGARRATVRAAVVTGDSMLPTLRPGDRLLLADVGIRPGDVVAARHPGEPGLLLVKRVAWREGAGWWLVSDNPAAPGASDSFRFGAVADADVIGRALLRYHPVRRARWLGRARERGTAGAPSQ